MLIENDKLLLKKLAYLKKNMLLHIMETYGEKFNDIKETNLTKDKDGNIDNVTLVTGPQGFGLITPQLLLNLFKIDSKFSDRVSAYCSALNFYGPIVGFNDTVSQIQITANILHESGLFRWNEELGKGGGKSYSKPVNGHSYYGRGYLQLTWASTYEKVNNIMKGWGITSDIYNNPDSIVNNPIISAATVFGWIGLKLSEHVRPDIIAKSGDISGFRRIVNGGQNNLAEVANYTQRLASALNCTNKFKL